MTQEATPGDRIALLIPVLAGGGAERVMVNLARALVDEGLQVDMVVLRAEGDLVDEVRSLSGVRLVVLACAKSSTSPLALALYLRRVAPFAVVSALYTLTVSCIVAARISGYRGRVIATIHNTISTDAVASRSLFDTVSLTTMRIVFPWADAVVAVSNGVADDIPAAIGLRRDRVTVIYNPVVSPALFVAAVARPSHPWLMQADVPVVVGIGRLASQKDFSTLVRAFQLVREKRRCRLVILGEGPDRADLERLARELGIADDVDLPGFASNPYAVLAHAGVFVLSSKWEGLPTVLIEALALGTPLVATDCPSGPREILQDGRLGCLTPVGDVNAMAEAIRTQLRQSRNAERGAMLSEPYTFKAAARAYLALARA